MKRQFLVKACLILLFFALSSCGNDLSRDKAASLIEEAYQFPKTETTAIAKQYVVKTSLVEPHTPGICRFTDFPMASAMLKAMQDKQLISMSESTTTKNACNHILANIVLTDKGREYLINETDKEFVIRTAEITIDEVTGIRPNKESNAATAEYTLKRINVTPFATDNATAPQGGQAEFLLYDDGWRVE